MFTEIIDRLLHLSLSCRYWLTYIVGGLILLATALYYQHYLEELPCVVCIQIRLWITLLVFVAIAGLLLRNNKLAAIATHLSLVFISIGLVERSYLLLGTERGFIFADCGFDLGLPQWLAVEQWLPWLYRVDTSCGYTPELLFNITMAEALMALSVLLTITTVSIFLAISISRFMQTNKQG